MSTFTESQIQAVIDAANDHFSTSEEEVTVDAMVRFASARFAALAKAEPVVVVAPVSGTRTATPFAQFGSIISKPDSAVYAALVAAMGPITIAADAKYSDKTAAAIAEMAGKGEGEDLFTDHADLTAALAACKKHKFSGFQLSGIIWNNLSDAQKASVKGAAPVAAPVALAAPKSSSGAKKQGHNIIKSAISAAVAAKDTRLVALIDQLKSHLGKSSAMDLGNGLWKRISKEQQTAWHAFAATMPADKSARVLEPCFSMLADHLTGASAASWAVIDAKA